MAFKYVKISRRYMQFIFRSKLLLFRTTVYHVHVVDKRDMAEWFRAFVVVVIKCVSANVEMIVVTNTQVYVVIPLIEMCSCDWFKSRHVV